MIFSAFGLKQYYNPHTPIDHSKNPLPTSHIHQVQVPEILTYFMLISSDKNVIFSANDNFCTPLLYPMLRPSGKEKVKLPMQLCYLYAA